MFSRASSVKGAHHTFLMFGRNPWTDYPFLIVIPTWFILYVMVSMPVFVQFLLLLPLLILHRFMTIWMLLWTSLILNLPKAAILDLFPLLLLLSLLDHFNLLRFPLFPNLLLFLTSSVWFKIYLTLIRYLIIYLMYSLLLILPLIRIYFPVLGGRLQLSHCLYPGCHRVLKWPHEMFMRPIGPFPWHPTNGQVPLYDSPRTINSRSIFPIASGWLLQVVYGDYWWMLGATYYEVMALVLSLSGSMTTISFVYFYNTYMSTIHVANYGDNRLNNLEYSVLTLAFGTSRVSFPTANRMNLTRIVNSYYRTYRTALHVLLLMHFLPIVMRTSTAFQKNTMCLGICLSRVSLHMMAYISALIGICLPGTYPFLQSNAKSTTRLYNSSDPIRHILKRMCKSYMLKYWSGQGSNLGPSAI